MTLVQQIWHGDSIELCSRFKEGRVDLILTDPPFGVDNLSLSATSESGKKYARKIANDESPETAIKTFKSVMSVLLPKTADNSDMYVFTSYQVLSEWLVMTDAFLKSYEFTRKAILIWQKDGPGMGDLNIPWGMGCEFILYFQKGRREKSAKRRNNVLSFSQVHPSKLIHPHEKPLPLLETLIKTSTVEGNFIVDPFAGSGSTVRAARSVERSCVGIECDEQNYELALKAFEGKDGFF